MDYQWYKILHIVGILMVFTALGGLALRSADNGKATPTGRKLTAIGHGLGLVIVLVSGFGLLAKLSLGFDPWVIGKLLIWLFLGGMLVLIRKMPHLAALWYWALPIIGGIAAWLALFKVGA